VGGVQAPSPEGGWGDQTDPHPPVTCLQPCHRTLPQRLSLRLEKGPNRGRRGSRHRSNGGGQEGVGGWGKCTRGMGLRADGGHDTSKMWCGCFGKEGQFWRGENVRLLMWVAIPEFKILLILFGKNSSCEKLFHSILFLSPPFPFLSSRPRSGLWDFGL